ncbi:hypothetical protein RSOLAG22IIIB_03252 [Rhizoctonia solani]|uniref:Uncharacterized protein n=1 Tax=Rhizoctonia solani TaxID=456999 RepID=A0A0K6FNQ5_9AGAM|nr:hypothetical protein RSOLAG22IIIB_03252 [Rhizoctonia solani]
MPHVNQKKLRKQLTIYVERLKYYEENEAVWKARWHKLHGEGKAWTKGAYRVVTSKGSNGDYLLNVIGTSRGKIIIARAGSPAPTLANVVDVLMKEFGLD